MKNLTSLILVLAGLLMILISVNCVDDEAKRAQRDGLNTEVKQLQNKKEVLLESISNLSEQYDSFKFIEEDRQPLYILKLKVYQTRFSLDLGKHLKDKMNALEIELPVSKSYYDKLRVNDLISEEFRIGSLLMSGTFGNWNIKVVDKYRR